MDLGLDDGPVRFKAIHMSVSSCDGACVKLQQALVNIKRSQYHNTHSTVQGYIFPGLKQAEGSDQPVRSAAGGARQDPEKPTGSNSRSSALSLGLEQIWVAITTVVICSYYNCCVNLLV